MTGEIKAYVPPLRISSEDREKLAPFVCDLGDGKQVKMYFDRLGYKWEFNGRSGVAHYVQWSIAKLDSRGDIKGDKKTLNIPVSLTEKDLKHCFAEILKAMSMDVTEQETQVKDAIPAE